MVSRDNDLNRKWADTAPDYKKNGGMYATVEHDTDGNPRRIVVAQDQVVKGKFNMDGSTAVYEPHNITTAPQAGEETAAYVESLPFVESVDMSAVEGGDSDA